MAALLGNRRLGRLEDFLERRLFGEAVNKLQGRDQVLGLDEPPRGARVGPRLRAERVLRPDRS
jgi:hypothetical protein